MPSYKPLRFVLAVFMLVALLISAGVVFGQDDSGITSPDTGTPGLTKALDDLNLPPIPPAPPLPNDDASGTPSPTATPPTLPPDAVCTCTPVEPITRTGTSVPPLAGIDKQMAASVPRLVRFGRSGFNVAERESNMVALVNLQSRFGVVGMRFGDLVSPMIQMKNLIKNRELAFQSGESFQHDGFTIAVTDDYQIKVTADDGTEWFSGQAGVVGTDRVIIQGTDDKGFQYAIADGYFMANTPEGDVLIDNGTTTYKYDFDKTGALVGLSDSDGHPYTVETDGSGTTSINDADGITSTFAEDGSFMMADAEGKVLEESSLYGDDEPTIDDGAPTQEAGDQTGANSGSEAGSGESDHSGEAGSGESGG